jgi:hypothetical protein
LVVKLVNGRYRFCMLSLTTPCSRPRASAADGHVGYKRKDEPSSRAAADCGYCIRGMHFKMR